jgi:hypothetical protein
MSKNTPLNSPFRPIPPSLRPAVAVRDFLRAGALIKKGEIIEVTEKEFIELLIAKAVKEPTAIDDLKSKSKEFASAFLPAKTKKKGK